MKTAPAVSVPASAGGFDLIQGISSAITLGETLPESIQLFPPGVHSINATRAGQPVTLTVNVDQSVSDVIKADFMEILKASDSGNGAKPFIDFNHDNSEASGWVTDVYWAGEDPKTGGIRAKVDWSKPGKEAIQGKSYRQFSPNFRVSSDTGAIVGTTPNMGGLVNTPAFREIQPLFAKEAGATTIQPTKEPIMKQLLDALVAAGLLSAVPTDDAAAVADFQKNWNAMGESEMEAAKCATDKVNASMAAKDLEIVSAKQAVTDIQAKMAALQETHADFLVSAAVADGVLAPKDEPAKAMWKKAIAADPEAVKLLRSFNVAAKASANTPAADITKPVILQKPEVDIAPGADKFNAIVATIQAKEKCSTGKAIQIAAKAYPDEYKEHRSQSSTK